MVLEKGFRVLLLLVGPAWALMVFPEGKEAEIVNPSWSGHHEVFSDVLVGKQQQQQHISEETLPSHEVISEVLRSVIHPVHGVIHDDRKLTFEHALAGVGGLAAGAAALTAYNHYNQQRPKPTYNYNHHPVAYPGYNHHPAAAYGGYNQPQYHGYNRPHYQKPYGTHPTRPSNVNPYNTHPSYGTPQNLVHRPTNHYVNTNQHASQPKPNQHQEGTQGANPAPVAISHGQVYHPSNHPSNSPVALSGWYPVQGKSTISNVLTGGLGLAAGAAIANHLSKPRPYYGSSYGSNYGRPSLSYGSYGRPGNGYYKPSYGHTYGYNRPGYGGYRRPVYY